MKRPEWMASSNPVTVLNRALHGLALLVGALPFFASAQQMPLRYVGQQDGLANLAVKAIARDHAGYVWVGTENGLFRYNGAAFRRYAQGEGLGETSVSALLVDHDDNLWVGSYNGLFVKVGDRLTPVLAENRKPVVVWPPQSLASAPDGKRYVVAEGRLWTLILHGGQPRMERVFSEQRIAESPALGHLESVYADRDGALWMGCGTALCQQGPGGLAIWDEATGVPGDKWVAILRDRQGSVWARGSRHIVVLPPMGRRFVERTPSGGVLHAANLHPNLVEDPDGRILGNADDGLMRWNQAHWEHYGFGNGLRSAGGLNALQFDGNGDPWLGSSGLGLINWRGYGNWENWTAGQGLPSDVVLSFARGANGTLYAGTRAGLARLRPGEQHFTPVAAGPHGVQWSSLARDRDGQVWAGTYSGTLARMDDGGRPTLHATGLPLIYRLLADDSHRLWLATNQGIAVMDAPLPGRTVRRPDGWDRLEGASAKSYTAICQGPRGTLWFLAADELLRLDNNHWSRHGTNSMVGGALLENMSCAADGSLWLSDSRQHLWRAVLEQQGLKLAAVDVPLLDGAQIFGLHEDRRGWLWIATDRGVAAWNRRQWRFFNQNDGLAWNDTNGNVFYEEDDGSMWIATSNGASHVRDPERLFSPQRLGVRIESARSNRQAMAAAPDQPWVLPWSDASLELELASLHFQNRDMLRFHYRLAGLDDHWVESAAPQLRYTALPPGSYTFEYYASNRFSDSVSPIQRHTVTILPPWWRTPACYAAGGVLVSLFLVLAYRLRVRQLVQRQLYAERLVRERTRELEQSREQLRQRALKDSLTGVWNRGAIMELIEQAIAQASARQQPMLLVLLDLDHFKRVNDVYGHAAGDAVLREAAARLGAAVRQSDAVGRYGGEEFLVVLPGLDAATGHARVEQLRLAIRGEPIRISERQAITVTGSFGAIMFDPALPLPLAELIARADQALYRSKEHGRDRIEYAA